MRLAFVGVGQAGGKIVERFLEYDAGTGGFVESAVAINTAAADLEGLERVPEENRLLIGGSQVGGRGVGADNELAAKIAHEDSTEIRSVVDSVSTTGVDAVLVVAGLGGGTGSGAGPVIAGELQQVRADPVYALGILPGESEGSVYTVNAARSLKTYVEEADSVLLFDNGAWRNAGESVGDGFEQINTELVCRFGLLFGAGERAGRGTVFEGVVDASGVIETLGRTGVSTLGYAESPVDPDAPTPGSSRAASRITGLVEQAVRGRLTMPCEPQEVERALVVVSGPPDHLDRAGIEQACDRVEAETGTAAVSGGASPVEDADRVSVGVLFSGVREAPRLESIAERAVEAKAQTEHHEAESNDQLEALLDDGELDSLI